MREQLTPWPRMLRASLPAAKLGRSRSEGERVFLLLSWNFPPLINGGVYRPSAICQGADRAGWRVSVLAGEMPVPVTDAGRYLVERIPASVRVIRQRVHGPRAGSRLFPRVDGGWLNALEAFHVVTEQFRDAPPPIVVATGPPFQSFVAGMWIANHFGSRLVLDYRDEWTEGPHDHIQRDGKNRQWEGRCIRRADRVVFTTRSQLRHQVNVFPWLDAGKCVVVPNGWDPDDFVPVPPAQRTGGKSPGTPARIMFFGNLGTWWNLPDVLQPMARAFADDPSLRDRVELHFVGKHAPAARRAVDDFPFRDRIVLTDHVPKTTACDLMRQADVLLLMNPPSLNRYIPGKTFEYVAAGPPILVYGAGGEMQEIVNELDAGLIVPAGDAAALACGIHRLLDAPPARSPLTAAWLASHTRQKTIEKFIAILNELLPRAAQT